MREFCLVGDPHVKHKTLKQTEELFAVVEDIGRPVIWLGDLQDTKEVIRGKVLNTWLRYFQRSKLQHIILVGNHDYFNLECLDHSLEVFKLLPNVIVVDTPIVIDNLVFVPFVHDQTKLKAIITKYADSTKTLIGHLELAQFDFGNGHLCTKGLNLSDVAGYKRVISGHFHKYQNRGNLTYLGTPFSQSFGESDQIKYLGLYDADYDDLKTAESGFARHITKEFNCDDLNKTLDHWIIDTDPGFEKHFYRIILTGAQANIDRFPKYMYEKLNIKWIQRPSDHAENDVTIDETVSNEAQFVKWASDVRKMESETLELGLSILETCK